MHVSTACFVDDYAKLVLASLQADWGLWYLILNFFQCDGQEYSWERLDTMRHIDLIPSCIYDVPLAYIYYSVMNPLPGTVEVDTKGDIACLAANKDFSLVVGASRQGIKRFCYQGFLSISCNLGMTMICL